jgi:hypothetical protein
VVQIKRPVVGKESRGGATLGLGGYWPLKAEGFLKKIKNSKKKKLSFAPSLFFFFSTLPP